jgi:hypothetical protein
VLVTVLAVETRDTVEGLMLRQLHAELIRLEDSELRQLGVWAAARRCSCCAVVMVVPVVEVDVDVVDVDVRMRLLEVIEVVDINVVLFVLLLLVNVHRNLVACSLSYLCSRCGLRGGLGR